jgi:hypothetical protein
MHMVEDRQMPYTIAQDRTLALVELTFSGLIKDATAECATLQRETGVTRFLVDGRDWDVVTSVVDIFDLPASQYWKEKLYTRTRIAVVLTDSTRSREVVYFYENACRKRALECPRASKSSKRTCLASGSDRSPNGQA